jgi:viroplasmin and RNaseH domain-containing protein
MLRGTTGDEIYVSWALCKSQVFNYPGAEFRAFNTYESALEYLGTAKLITESHKRQAYFDAGNHTATELTTIVEASTQTTRDRGLKIYIEGIALGFIVGAIATLWILPQL